MTALTHHLGIPPSVAYATLTLCGAGFFVHALFCLTATFLDLLSQGDEP